MKRIINKSIKAPFLTEEQKVEIFDSNIISNKLKIISIITECKQGKLLNIKFRNNTTDYDICFDIKTYSWKSNGKRKPSEKMALSVIESAIDVCATVIGAKHSSWDYVINSKNYSMEWLESEDIVYDYEKQFVEFEMQLCVNVREDNVEKFEKLINTADLNYVIEEWLKSNCNDKNINIYNGIDTETTLKCINASYEDIKDDDAERT